MENREKSRKFLKISIIYFVVVIAFVLVRVLSSLGVFNGLQGEITADLVSTLIIQVGIMFLIPFCLYLAFFKKNPKQLFKDFGYKKISAKAVLICFGIGILAFVVNCYVSTFFSIVLSYIGFNPQYTSVSSGYDTLPKFLYGVLSVAIMPALFEEFAHRGLLLRGTSDSVGYKKALVLSSVLFGLMHLNIQQFFYATLLGLLMGLVATITRSIWPSVIMHFCNNFINVFLSYSESTNLFGFSASGALNTIYNKSIILFFVFAILVLFLAVFGIFVLVKKLFIETGAKSYNSMMENIEGQIRNVGGENMTDGEVIAVFEKYVFPNMKSPKNLLDLYVADNNRYDELQLKYKIPMISCLVLGILITVFTFIWGVI